MPIQTQILLTVFSSLSKYSISDSACHCASLLLLIAQTNMVDSTIGNPCSLTLLGPEFSLSICIAIPVMQRKRDRRLNQYSQRQQSTEIVLKDKSQQWLAVNSRFAVRER
jgi:hypothetical protein